MNVTLLKRDGQKEVINRINLDQMAGAIQGKLLENSVRELREYYHLMKTQRLDDGQIATNWKGGIKLPRVCFAAEWVNRKGQRKMLNYNGLVVLEVNNLPNYEKAVEIRELAKKLPETLMCFLGGSGKSVKIVCRGELFDGGLPEGPQSEGLRAGQLVELE